MRAAYCHTTRRAGFSLTRWLENLWRYVKELVAKDLGVTSGSAHLATAGSAMMADPTLREMVLFVSDDASPPNPNAANPEISENLRPLSYSRANHTEILRNPC